MLNLILIDIQYSQKAVLALKKVRIIKFTSPRILFTHYKNPPGKISDYSRKEENLPQPLPLFEKPC